MLAAIAPRANGLCVEDLLSHPSGGWVIFFPNSKPTALCRGLYFLGGSPAGSYRLFPLRTRNFRFSHSF